MVSIAAASKNTSCPPSRVAPTEYRYATRMPVAIRVIIVTSRWRSDRAAEEMNGHPPHHTTGVASSSPNQPVDSPNGGVDGNPSACPTGENQRIGMVSAAEITNRRSMSVAIATPCPAWAPCPPCPSSWLAWSSAADQVIAAWLGAACAR